MTSCNAIVEGSTKTTWICLYAVVYTYNINETKSLRWNIRGRNVENSKTQHEIWNEKWWLTHGLKAACFPRALSVWGVSTICFAEHGLKTVRGICLFVWISHLWVVATRLLSWCPPPIRVWEGGPKRNGWWKKRFFNPSLPHPWYVKRHTSIYSCVVPRDMFCVSGLKGLQRGLNKRNNMQVSQTEG